jgi:hypothetical protein
MPAGVTAMYSNINDLSSIAIQLDPNSFLANNPCYLYSNIDMTQTKSNGYYSDGNYWYRVTGNSGRITEAGSCG